MLHIFGVIVFHRSLVNWNWEALDMCILLYVKLLMVLWYSIHLWSIGGGTYALSICAFFYMSHVFGVVVFHRSLVNWRKKGLGICAFCHMWNFCGGVVFLLCMVNWRGVTSALNVCVFCYMWNLFGVMVFHRSIFYWRKGGLGICAFCYTWNFCNVAAFHTSMVNWMGVHLP